MASFLGSINWISPHTAFFRRECSSYEVDWADHGFRRRSGKPGGPKP